MGESSPVHIDPSRQLPPTRGRSQPISRANERDTTLPGCSPSAGSGPSRELSRGQVLAACANLPQISADTNFQARFDQKQGWLGADGAYSLPLPGGKVLWLFSDTICGEIGDRGELKPGWSMLHNSWGLQASAQGPLDLRPESLFPGKDEHSWYWVYSGRSSGPTEAPQVEIFLGSFEATQGPEGFNFRQNGAALARVRVLDGQPQVEEIRPFPHFCAGPPPTHWGAAVVPHEDQLLVYGTRDFGNHKQLVVAKTPALGHFQAWTFWDGQQWQSHPQQAQPILDGVANELSVDVQQGQFRVLAQQGEKLIRHHSPSPTGPFHSQEVWQIPPHAPGVVTYNAKLHPHLKEGESELLTYNQNVLPLQALIDNPALYRPQCLRYRESPLA